jgi:hypothetical protein
MIAHAAHMRGAVGGLADPDSWSPGAGELGRRPDGAFRRGPQDLHNDDNERTTRARKW